MSDDKGIRIYRDGDQWCALRGPNLQEGESGFGPTPEAALRDLQIIEIRQAEYAQICSLVQARCNGGWRTCGQCPFLTDDRCDRDEIRKLVSSEGLR